jgi:uncharacterized protein YfaP (DUF2135 family)
MKTKKRSFLSLGKWLVYFVLFAVILTASGCSKKKSAIPLLPLALTGEEEGSSSSGTKADDNSGQTVNLNPEGDPLPESSGTSSTPAVSTTSTPAASSQQPSNSTLTSQKVSDTSSPATSGPATISGKVDVKANTSTSQAYCTAPNVPEGCIDPTGITVKLLDSAGNEVASTNLDANGNYTFNLDNLANGNYTVSVPGGNGVTGASQVIDFSYNTAGSGATVVRVDDIKPYMTSGPAKINGKIEVMATEDSRETYCTSPGVPAGCFDPTQITVSLLDANGKVVVTTKPDANGNYTFDVSKLSNGNYQVFIPTANGVNTASQNFDFTFDPTKNGANVVEVATIKPFSRTFNDGAAKITGLVKTPGYLDALGNTVLAAGSVEGVVVKLYKQDANGSVTINGIKYTDTGKTATTNDSGVYEINLNTKEGDSYPLENGKNYLILVDGSEKTQSNRNFEDSTSQFKFNYSASKNDNSVVQIVDLGASNLIWNAATSSSLAVTGSLTIASPSGNSKEGFTVKLKDSAGNVLATATTDSNGNYSFNKSGLTNGTYEIEISKTGFNTVSNSFNFVADATGGTVSRTMDQVKVLPIQTKVTGSITDGGNPVPGAVINFRPNASLTTAQIQYIVDNYPELKNAALKWQAEIQATGKAQTFLSKTYEKDANGNLFFEALPGIWDYYVSANGYESTAVKTITLDGTPQNRNETVVSSTKRSRIAGTAVVLDTLIDGTKNAYPGATPGSGYTNKGNAIPGLVTVMLNSKDAAGNPVAHIAITGADGSYEFTDLHVVLPSTLSSDAQRVAYAVGEFTKCLANQSSAMKSQSGGAYGTCNTGTNAILTTSTGGTEPIYLDGGKFFFKEGSYSVFTVDPKQHMDSSLTVIDNKTMAVNASAGMTAVANGTSLVSHLPRRKISGTVSDAISTGLVSGATLKLCTAIDANNTCTFARRDNENIPSTSRLIGGDETVPTVTSGVDGTYSFNNIDPGTYKIQVLKDGFVTSVIEVVVPKDGTGLTNGNELTNVNPKIIKDGARGNIRGVVKIAGGFPFTGPYSIEVIHPVSGIHPTSGVIPAGIQSGSVTFGPNASQFNIYSVNPGEWRVRFVAAGYKTVEGLVTVQSDATTNFEVVTMIPDSQPPASVTGVVRSAMNNRPVAGLTVTLRPGLNVQSGSLAIDVNGVTLPTVTTQADGSFVIPNVPAGNYTVEIGGNGTCNGVTDSYATTYGTVISAGTDTPSSQDFLISPKLGTDEVRIVLSWGAQPKDLDSHLEYGSARPNQVVWDAKNKLGGDLTLDIDVVTGYGPETVTMKGSVWSQARRGYSVYNWTKGQRDSNATTIANSGAVVRVFKGSQGLVRTYVAGPGQTELWWQIFCLDTNKNIVDVGQPGCSAGDFFNSPVK